MRETADRGGRAGLWRSARPAWSFGDIAALTALVAIILVAVGFRWVYDDWLSHWDIFTFFLPNYGYVGDRIRSFQIPAWNPYFSSGSPMAGDAGGGWMYLPVMISFALFNVATGMKVMVLLQALIGGLATYLFGRRLGLVPLAALVAASAVAVGPALYDATGQSTVIAQISVFIAVGLVGAESAVRASRWSARLAWSGLAGVALVQLFAAWPQGFVYGAMLIAGWFAYRGLVAPLPEIGSRRVQLGRVLVAGVATVAFAAAFGAAALLPRLDFLAQSTIAGGDYSNVEGGGYVADPFPLMGLLSVYLQDSFFWRITELNSVILLLGLLAILLGPNRYGVAFFAVSSWLFIDLAATESLSRDAFYRLPGFERVHSHRPTATMYMVFLPFAVLAGAGVQLLFAGHQARWAWLRKLLPLPILLLASWAVERAGYPVSRWQVWLPVAATVLIALATSRFAARWWYVRARMPELAGIGLLVLSLVYPSGVDFLRTMQHPEDGENNLLSKNEDIQLRIQTVLARHEPGRAADVLQEVHATEPPFRYAAYFGATRSPWHLVVTLAHARSARLGLEQISGYNPLHLKYYVEYVEAMNGRRQNYHWLDVTDTALAGSQLLDMLNVRFVLVPADLSDPPPMAAFGAPVYRDDLVVVYENPHAFPRAWLVHDVRPNRDGDGLALLASGAVDGHEVAFVDGAIPPAGVLGRPGGAMNGSDESVVVASLQPETVTIQATSGADGLLVVSQPYAEGWTASVDGAAVDVLRTNHALQGVPLAAGTHTVVLHYAPWSLAVGLWITGGSIVALVAVWALVLADGTRRRWPLGRVRQRSAPRGQQ